MDSRSYVLPLWIAGKHLHDEIVQAIVKLLLKNPRKLLALNFAGAQQKHIGMHLRLGGRILNHHFDALGCWARVEHEERVLVLLQLGEDFFGEFIHCRYFAMRLKASSS